MDTTIQYKRAIQTMEGLAELFGLDIVVEEDFRERLLSEKPVENFERAITKVWEDDSFSWEGGESNIAAQIRGVRALEKVLERYEGKNIAIGIHGNKKQLDMPDIYQLRFDKGRLIEVKRIWCRS